LALIGTNVVYSLFAGVQISFQPPDLTVYLPLLVVGLPNPFIQISSDELLFRGYTMQFARRLSPIPC
jgi:membrane protease YdiL (CAAX protease family)